MATSRFRSRRHLTPRFWTLAWVALLIATDVLIWKGAIR